MKDIVTSATYRRWLLLILLTAVFLRLYALGSAPPGLTHDEADHGITAWEIVQGARAVYFTVGYGREPLYDYATAGLMALIGPTYLAGRLTAVLFSLLLIVGMTSWTRRAFDEPTALLTAAGLAVGFWPVMTGRQALRSIALPALFVAALALWQWGVGKLETGDWGAETKERSLSSLQSPIFFFILAGLVLGATFYTYIPARVMWGLFPALLLFTAWRQRTFFKQVWRGTAVMLAVAFVVASPLFYYLATHPGVEVRIDELWQPLTAVTEGNFQPLLKNMAASLRLFTIEGDMTWRYNIPGRPFLQPIMGGLFYLGLFTAVGQIFSGTKRVARGAFFALAWLLAGLAPVLVTGPELSMTQAMGMQPVLYLFPALSLVTIGRIASLFTSKRQERKSPSHLFTPPTSSRPTSSRPPLHIFFVLLLFGATAAATFRDYFTVWANAPEVRVQYEATMLAAMEYLNEQGAGETAVSTITPHAYHSPAVAQLTLHNEDVSLHWFDAQRSLLLPAGDASTIILPGFTPLPPLLAGYFDTAVLDQTLPLRPTDQDRPLDIYHVNGDVMREAWLNRFNTEMGGVNFGDGREVHVEFLGVDLPTTAVHPGDLVQVATLWRVKRPLDGAVLFTQMLPEGALTQAGVPIAQNDRLDAPGAAWQAGDWFIQLHEFIIPTIAEPGDYPIAIGVYTCPGGVPCPDGVRLTTAAGDNTLYIAKVTIIP